VGERGGVEVRIGDSAVMMFDARDGLPHTPASLRLYAPDATTAYQRALAAGATPATEVTALRDQPA
jgi:PhnB protein